MSIYKQKLLELYQKAKSPNFRQNLIDKTINKEIEIIADNCLKNKGVYTVLITLLIYKIIHPEQDIRYHQAEMKDETTQTIIGFSGRSVDTKYITPTLKELGLPSMAESGWLTRSLEQPFPYNLKYEGKITPLQVKQAFLHIIDFIQQQASQSHLILSLLLNLVIQKVNASKIQVIKKINGDKININSIINYLDNHFSFNYKTTGGAKLPVLAFYAIYSILIKEMARYKNCYLEVLGSHTASDLNSKSAGDIVIKKNNQDILEAIEIKYGKEIDIHIIRRVRDKIMNYNPVRYYIFSSKYISSQNEPEIKLEITNILNEHGCQVIVNGIIPTLKYYLRLISNLEEFINQYGHLIEIDTELKPIHKKQWNQLLLEN